MNEHGIKELKELIGVLKPVAVLVKKVAADGKVDLKDLGHLVDLGKDFDVFVAAFTGLDKMVEEVKDLEGSEVLAIVTELVALVEAVKEA